MLLAFFCDIKTMNKEKLLHNTCGMPSVLYKNGESSKGFCRLKFIAWSVH